MARFSITVSIPIPKDIVERLCHVQLGEHVKFDWRHSLLCHITLKAIGVGDHIPGALETWSDTLERELRDQCPFVVTLNGLGAFPNAIYSQVISEELISVHKKLFQVLPSSQPQFENDQYTPHASLAMTSAQTTFSFSGNPTFGSFEVRDIELVVWDLENLKDSKVIRMFSLRPKQRLCKRLLGTVVPISRAKDQ